MAPDGRAPTHARVLVAGGGVAALEVVLALWHRTGGALRPTLLAPETHFRYRPLAAYADLVATGAPTVDLAEFAAEHGAGLVRDRLERVEPDGGAVVTAGGSRIAYDALVLATGAIRHEGLPGAITLGAPGDEPALAAVIERVRDGVAGRLAVVVPPGIAWSLPAYELALLLQQLAPSASPTRVAVVTSEEIPMAVAGVEFAAAIGALLARRGIELCSSTRPDGVTDGLLRMPLRGASRVDAVIALPRLSGPALPGLPCDERGFVAVDGDGCVLGQRRVWAAGDVAAHEVKQGGLAVQQADAVAEQIARHLGLEQLPPAAAPDAAVLRAALLDGEGTLYLRAEWIGGTIRTQVSREPLWSPPAKIAGGRLPAYLAERDGSSRPPSAPAA